MKNPIIQDTRHAQEPRASVHMRVTHTVVILLPYHLKYDSRTLVNHARGFEFL